LLQFGWPSLRLPLPEVDVGAKPQLVQLVQEIRPGLKHRPALIDELGPVVGPRAQSKDELDLKPVLRTTPSLSSKYCRAYSGGDLWKTVLPQFRAVGMGLYEPLWDSAMPPMNNAWTCIRLNSQHELTGDPSGDADANAMY
jgi:hypothetical protein